MAIGNKVTVLMPMYNAEAYLREAIDSVLRQSYADFEFIIIDDGSTDDSVAIVESYDDPRIRLLRNHGNHGICYTLNRGIDESESEYIVRMDADDISEPRRIEWQMRYMDNHPEVGASGGNLIIFGEGIEPRPFIMNHDRYECRAELLFNSSMAHPATIIRRKVLEEHQLRYKEEYRGIEDFELWWQIAKHAFIVNQDKTLLRYRIHPQQVTSTDKPGIKRLAERFTAQRFSDLGIALNDDEASAVRRYSTNQYQDFAIDDITHFIDALQKAAQASITAARQLRAIRKIASYAFLNVINANAKRETDWLLCMRYAVECGVMPRRFYLKHLIYHKLHR